jgi:phosphoenolpyruvate-protein kinase (PTS system EI component)
VLEIVNKILNKKGNKMEYAVVIIGLVGIWKLIKTNEAKEVGRELTVVTVSSLKSASNIAKSGEVITKDWLEESLVESVEQSTKLEARLAKLTLDQVKQENAELNGVNAETKKKYKAELTANMAKLEALRKGL